MTFLQECIKVLFIAMNGGNQLLESYYFKPIADSEGCKLYLVKARSELTLSEEGLESLPLPSNR